MENEGEGSNTIAAPKLTAEQFSTAVRGTVMEAINSRSLGAARAVLVDGLSARKAAQQEGISNTAVSQAVLRVLNHARDKGVILQ